MSKLTKIVDSYFNKKQLINDNILYFFLRVVSYSSELISILIIMLTTFILLFQSLTLTLRHLRQAIKLTISLELSHFSIHFRLPITHGSAFLISLPIGTLMEEYWVQPLLGLIPVLVSGRVIFMSCDHRVGRLLACVYYTVLLNVLHAVMDD